MDAYQFDTALRSLAALPSRRGVVRTLAGLGLSSVLGPLLGLSEAEAKKKKKKKKKKQCTTNCSGKICGDDGCGGTCGSCEACHECLAGSCITQPNDTPCGGGKTCRGGICSCPTDCCADTDCPAGSGRTCQGGVCKCPPGQGNSGGVCAPIPEFCTEPVVPCNEGTCCSGTCTGGGVCACSAIGSTCFRDDYCCQDSPTRCVGFVCRA